MRNLRKLMGALFLAVCLSIVAPAAIPLTTNITTVEAAKVKLSKSKATLIKGQTLKLELKNNSKKVKWSSNNKKIVTVTSSGKISANKAGIATITARIDNKKYTCKVTVEQPKISKAKLVVEKGKSTTLSLTGTKQKVKWSSDNKLIATVSSKGKITGKKVGTAKITAAVANKKYTCKITVKKASTVINVEKITLNTTSATLKLNDTLSLSATISPSNVTNKTVTWSSSNSNIATVNASGLVTSLKAGTTIITAKASNKTATCTITVDDTGTRANPISAWNNTIFVFKPYSFSIGQTISLQLIEYYDGASAYEKVIDENQFNDVPTSTQQWVLMKFHIKYISGSDSLWLSNVLYSFFNESLNKNLSPTDYCTFSGERDGLSTDDILLYPGGESDTWIGMLINKSEGHPTFRIPTGVDSGYNTIYTWFTTKR